VQTIQDGWKEAREGMEFSINFLKNNARLDSPALLASPFLVIAVGYYGHKRNYSLTPQESDQLRRWALLANAKGRYSRGSSETILDQDLAILRAGNGADELLERLRQQVGLLEITPEELSGRTQRSALFKTMFLAFREAGAKDWRSQLQIALGHGGIQHKLQFHHIFPKNVLKGMYAGREADEIANLCFISGRSNRQISDKAPSQYFPELIQKVGPAPFEAQCIPADPSLLEKESYRAFLAERRQRIAQRLNEFLGT
jgi:hypothetical protein